MKRSTIVLMPAFVFAAIFFAGNALQWGVAALGFGALLAAVTAVGKRCGASPRAVFVTVWLVSLLAAVGAIAGGSYEHQSCVAAQHGGESDTCGLAMAGGLIIGALTAGVLGPITGWLAASVVRRSRYGRP